MDIEKICQLARLKLDDKEKENLSKDLNSILAYIDKLKESDVSGAPELTRSLEMFNNFREDEMPRDMRAEPEDLTRAAAEKSRGFIKVKGVFDVQD